MKLINLLYGLITALLIGIIVVSAQIAMLILEQMV